MLTEIQIENILSFKDLSLKLGPLNVLIGANASGKSNFIEVLRILQNTPRNLSAFFVENGGITEWLWKGERQADSASLEAGVSRKSGLYRIHLENSFGGFWVNQETFQTKGRRQSSDNSTSTLWLERYAVSAKLLASGMSDRRTVDQKNLKEEQSILSQIKDPAQYRDITVLAEDFDSIRVYKDWTIGSASALRNPQSIDREKHFVAEDASNLALVLNAMDQDESLGKVESYLQRLLPDYKRISTQVEGRRIQLALREKSFKTLVPATRMSDGTLRFLALMAILCHPKPPPLVCIEEPEIGLHPDALSLVAEALKDASSRTQLVVTTHSEALVDALSDDPESVVVCERGPDGASQMNRLKQDDLNNHRLKGGGFIYD